MFDFIIAVNQLGDCINNLDRYNSKNYIPILLIATILVFGTTTISMGIPTSFAELQYNSYGKDYDKASGLNKQNVNCNNIIINGLDSAGQGTTREDMLGAMVADEGEGGTGQWLVTVIKNRTALTKISSISVKTNITK